MKRTKAFNAYLNEARNWAYGSQCNGSLEFALKNGFDLHAVSLWLSSGASALNLPVKIPPKEEQQEIDRLCAYADIFACPHCNSHQFFDPGEIEDDSTQCDSCLKTAVIYSRGKL